MTNSEFRYSLELEKKAYAQEKRRAKKADAKKKRREIARLAAVVYRFNQTTIEDAVNVARKIIEETEPIPSE